MLVVERGAPKHRQSRYATQRCDRDTVVPGTVCTGRGTALGPSLSFLRGVVQRPMPWPSRCSWRWPGCGSSRKRCCGRPCIVGRAVDLVLPGQKLVFTYYYVYQLSSVLITVPQHAPRQEAVDSQQRVPGRRVAVRVTVLVTKMLLYIHPSYQHSPRDPST